VYTLFRQVFPRTFFPLTILIFSASPSVKTVSLAFSLASSVDFGHAGSFFSTLFRPGLLISAVLSCVLFAFGRQESNLVYEAVPFRRFPVLVTESWRNSSNAACHFAALDERLCNDHPFLIHPKVSIDFVSFPDDGFTTLRRCVEVFFFESTPIFSYPSPYPQFLFLGKGVQCPRPSVSRTFS